MNKIKKLLALVLSLGLVASTVVLPAQAATTNGEDIIATFDDDNGASGIFGTQGTYELVAGNGANNGYSFGLAADDTVAKLYTGTKGESTVAGSYLNGTSWGDATPWEKGTLKFDILTTNTWFDVNVLPTARNRYGVTLAAGGSQAVKALTNGWTAVDTGKAYQRGNGNWMEIACEFDIPNDTYKLYVNGEVAYQTTTAGFDKNFGVPADWQITGGEKGGGYAFVNNLYFYEGTYADAPADPKYITYAHKYKFDDDVTTNLWNANSGANGSWSVVPGTATGKAASDKVLQISRLDNSGAFTIRTNTYSGTVDGNTATASLKVYQPSTGNAAAIQLGYYANAASDSTGIVGNISLSADGAWTLSSRANNTASTIATTAADSTQLDKWHEVAVTMTKATSSTSADGTIKYYIDGTLMYTQTGLQINTFTKDIRVQSGYGNYNGSVHYIDDYFLYADEYLNWNGTEYEEPTEAPTEAPATEAPATEAPTEAPATEAPTEAPAESLLPITYTFDGSTETDFMGTNGTYTIIAGNGSVNGSLGLDASDNVLTLKAQSTNSSKDIPGSYLFGQNWGDRLVGVKHATIEFDFWTGNAWDGFYLYPTPTGTGYNADRVGLNMSKGSNDANGNECYDVQTTDWQSGSQAKTSTGALLARKMWHKVAIEYDMNNGMFYAYLDNVKIAEVDGLTVGNDVPGAFQMGCVGTAAGVAINNVKVYEGAYVIPTPEPTEAPTEAPTEEPGLTLPLTYTFDNGTDDGLFGVTGTYEVVDGNGSLNGGALGLNPADKVAFLKAAGTGTNTTPNALSFGNSRGDKFTGYKHVTIQFDYFTGNAYDRFYLYPNSSDRVGINTQNVGNQMVDVGTLEGSWTHVSTGASFPRREWHELAIEYNMNEGKAIVYLDGTAVKTVTSGLTVGADVPADFEIKCGGTNSGMVMNNFYVYEGGYDADAIEDPTYAEPTPEPTPVPTECPQTIEKEYYFNESDAMPWNGEIVSGTVAGKVASDKVWKYTGPETMFPTNTWNSVSAYPQATLQFDLYMTNAWNEVHIWGSSGSGKNRPAFDIESQSGNSQSVGINDGGSYSTTAHETTVTTGQWYQFALEFDAKRGVATLYMNGVAVDTLEMTGHTMAPTDLKIQVYTPSSTNEETGVKTEFPVYFDNIIWSSGLYNNWEAPEAPVTDVDFGVLATGDVYTRDGVDYVFMAVTTGLVADMSLYDMFVCTDGVDTKGIALSELAGTTVTGAAEIGVLVMNVPFANKDNFKAKLMLAD